MTKVYGIDFRLSENWAQQDPHACGFFCLSAALALGKSTFPTPPRHIDCVDLLQAITDADIRKSIGVNDLAPEAVNEVQGVRAKISASVQALEKRRGPLTLPDRLSNFVVGAAVCMIQRVTDTSVGYHSKSTLAQACSSRECWGKAPVKVFFGALTFCLRGSDDHHRDGAASTGSHSVLHQQLKDTCQGSGAGACLEIVAHLRRMHGERSTT